MSGFGMKNYKNNNYSNESRPVFKSRYVHWTDFQVPNRNGLKFKICDYKDECFLHIYVRNKSASLDESDLGKLVRSLNHLLSGVVECKKVIAANRAIRETGSNKEPYKKKINYVVEKGGQIKVAEEEDEREDAKSYVPDPFSSASVIAYDEEQQECPEVRATSPMEGFGRKRKFPSKPSLMDELATNVDKSLLSAAVQALEPQNKKGKFTQQDGDEEN